MNFNLRHAARQCLMRARELLPRGDEASIRYACLELRFAIEYITYSELEAYLSEVPNHVMKRWAPKQIISELKTVDPAADKSATIAIGREPAYGVPPLPEQMEIIGEDRRFSSEWANKNHNALGNFLHAPTLDQLENNNIPSIDSMKKKAVEVANKCDEILRATIFGVNLGNFFEFPCMECRTDIKRREGSFSDDQGIVCPKCSATYDLERKDSGEFVAVPRTKSYDCLSCRKKNHVPRHRVSVGTLLTCKFCGKQATVELTLVPKDVP